MATANVAYLDKLLLKGGLVQPVHYEQLRDVPREHLLQWCVKNAVYQLPTWELIWWLKREIAGRSAIEICAGKSCLGRHLGIPMTDNFMQARPEVALYYALMKQPTIIPPDDVIQMEANEAIRHFRPQVVIGAWVSQRRLDENDFSLDGGNCYGPDEHDILDSGCTYIHIGNEGPHRIKRIRLRPYRELSFPWLMGRGFQANLNRIWVWDAA